MTAVAAQTKRTSRQRRIIERPRLIERLEAINARTILLVAPAGYGKTTLARQWGRSLARVIWISATRSHRDVVTFSEDIANGADALGGEAASFIDQYMRARPNPQRAAREIANALAPRVENARAQWLIIDDYHELAESPEVEEMVRILRERLSCRFLVASRTHPDWATGRGVIHGEVEEVGADELALTPDETTQVLGKRPDLAPLIEQAKGWPAVVTLAAGLDAAEHREDAIPSMLHRYVAEELFRSASEELRDALIALALLPDLQPARVATRFDGTADHVVHQARDLGFVTGDDRIIELHPLLREFLLAKLSEKPDAEWRVREAVDEALEAEAWDRALELVLRFDLEDLIDSTLQQAFKPLIRSGRLGTLAAFAKRVSIRAGFPPAAVDVVQAEVALRDGHLELAIQVGERALKRLGQDDDILLSRLCTVVAQAHHFLGRYDRAETLFQRAQTTAADEDDRIEAIHGQAIVKVYGESESPDTEVLALAEVRHRSPQYLLRHTSCVLTCRRYAGDLHGPLGIEEATSALRHVLDPRARTAFTYTVAGALRLRAEYRDAEPYLERLEADVRCFQLEFAVPYAHWTSATLNLGLRRFGEADRDIQALEDIAEQPHHRHHQANARVVRARLALQTGRPRDAVASLPTDFELPLTQAWAAEYLNTRALALACCGDHAEALHTLSLPPCDSRDSEMRVIARAAQAVVAVQTGESEVALELFELARQTGVWDPLVCALRAYPRLADVLSANQLVRPELAALWQRSSDQLLARRAGIRQRSTRSPGDLLTPRELEVLGLMASGLRNNEIAGSLYIAPSTVKVHVRHILERLGVRTRAEAVARFERLSHS